MGWLREWFDGILEAVLSIPKYIENRMQEMFYESKVNQIDRFITIKSLTKYFDALDPEWKEDPGVIIRYEARKSQLEAAGFDDMGDVSAGFFGSQIAKAIWLVKDKALPPIFDWIDTVKSGYSEKMDKLVSEGSMSAKEASKQKAEFDAQIESVKTLAKSGEFGLNAVVGFMLGNVFSPVIQTSLAPLWETLGQSAWQAMPNHLLDPGRLTDLTFRDAPNTAKYESQLRKGGFSDENIAALKKQFEFIPSPRDVILWAVREAFYPEYVEEYGLHDEYPTDAMKKYGSLSGLSEEYAKYFWASHWELPSLTMGYEMLHRSVPEKMSPRSELVTSYGGKEYYTVVGSEDLDKLFMAHDIMPWWRDKLKAISYHPITRVDLRRMWDMKVITREQLYKGYRDLGYNDENAELMTLWTVIYVLSGDLKDRYKKGWITEMTVKEELIANGMSEERAIEWVRTIVKAVKGTRVEKERDLTKADITKAVKKGTIEAAEAITLLTDMGYDVDEAEFIVVATVGELTGSPESFQEFRAITQRYKKAMGQKSEIPTKEVLEAEKEFKKKRTIETELKYRDVLKQLAEKEEKE